MEAVKNNILILDPGYSGKSLLKEILVKNGFNVHVSTGEADATASIDSFKPDIILCRATARMIKNNTQMCGLHDIAAGRRIPFAVISSGAGVDFFMKVLEHGLAHSITAPFNSEFLVSRVREILGTEPGEGEEAPVAMRLAYGGAEYSLRMRPAQISCFLMSLLRDSVSHSATLSEMIQHRNTLHTAVCRPELFDGVRSRTEEELDLERDLYRALDKGEFLLHYQPIISLADGRVSGFEALVRWNHPGRGLVLPGDFIPAAERSPVIIPLGFWIIEEATRQMAGWRKQGLAAEHLHVGVNLSARQFIHPELSGEITGILKRHRVAPGNIAFEITESAFMTDMGSANVQLLKLKSGKHSIYMDDFGTGYSSLSYLQHFPVDTLKIDRSFVRWMDSDEQSEHIVRSIVGLAHNLGLRVVAEGVEEEEHRRMLREISCDFGQGYLFSHPLDPPAAAAFLRNA